LFLEYLGRSPPALEKFVGPQVAEWSRPNRWTNVSNVLIVAREEVVAALLGLMVELRGLHPRFPEAGEAIERAIGRFGPTAVVLDCDHPDCDEDLLETIKRAGAKPILFSPYRLQPEVQNVAARLGTKSFTLPTDPDTFAKVLDA
jgi:DNA-binding response OmpR family regulator